MLEELLTRIRTIEETTESDEELCRQFRRQDWALRAIADLSRHAPVRTITDQLLGMLAAERVDGAEVRSASRALIAIARQQSSARSAVRSTLSLATISSVFGLISTWIAMLVGSENVAVFVAKFNTIWLDQDGRYDVERSMQVPRTEFTIAAIHVLVILLLLLLQFTDLGGHATRTPPRDEPSRTVMKQFRFGWIGVWASWLALYSWLAVGWWLDLRGGSGIDETLFWCMADLLNGVSGVFFFYLFLVLDQPSVPLADDTDRDRSFKMGIAIGAGIGVVLVSLSVLGRLDLLGMRLGGPLVLSLGAAIAMAYLFGRFDSQFMEVRRWTLAPLYLYVAIQVVWPGFADTAHENYVRTVLLASALILKVYLYLVVTFWLQRGHILRHVRDANRFAEQRDSEVVIHPVHSPHKR